MFLIIFYHHFSFQVPHISQAGGGREGRETREAELSGLAADGFGA
jgi:hypothetical protein